MKKGLLIGCLSTAILFAMLIVLSPIIAMMDMWGLFAMQVGMNLSKQCIALMRTMV